MFQLTRAFALLNSAVNAQYPAPTGGAAQRAAGRAAEVPEGALTATLVSPCPAFYSEVEPTQTITMRNNVTAAEVRAPLIPLVTETSTHFRPHPATG